MAFLFHVRGSCGLMRLPQHSTTRHQAKIISAFCSGFLVFSFFFFFTLLLVAVIMFVQPFNPPHGCSSDILSQSTRPRFCHAHTPCLQTLLSLIGWQLCGRRCGLIYWTLHVASHACQTCSFFATFSSIPSSLKCPKCSAPRTAAPQLIAHIIHFFNVMNLSRITSK